jgi:hypothetical protein
MTTERSSFDDPGVDAIVATREDELTGTGLDDAAPTTGAGYEATSTRTSTSGTSGDRLGEAAGGVAERVAETAQQTVGSQVDSGLDRASDLLAQVAGAVRQSGEQLRSEQPQVAGFADTAARQVDRVSQYLRQTDVQGLVRETEGFARRQPAVFLGGALAIGLIASRFLKASPEGGSGYRSGVSAGNRYRGSTGGYAGGYGASYGSGYGGGTGYAGTGATTYGTTRAGATTYGTSGVGAGSTGMTGGTGTSDATGGSTRS